MGFERLNQYLDTVSLKSMRLKSHIFTTIKVYRVVKRNQQVVKLVVSEHVNENMVQNSSPTCIHNLCIYIDSKQKNVC